MKKVSIFKSTDDVEELFGKAYLSSRILRFYYGISLVLFVFIAIVFLFMLIGKVPSSLEEVAYYYTKMTTFQHVMLGVNGLIILAFFFLAGRYAKSFERDEVPPLNFIYFAGIFEVYVFIQSFVLEYASSGASGSTVARAFVFRVIVCYLLLVMYSSIKKISRKLDS